MKKGENKRERNLDRDGAVGVEAAAVHVAAAVQPRGARLLRVVRVVVLRLCADPAVKKKNARVTYQQTNVQAARVRTDEFDGPTVADDIFAIKVLLHIKRWIGSEEAIQPFQPHCWRRRSFRRNCVHQQRDRSWHFPRRGGETKKLHVKRRTELAHDGMPLTAL